MKPQSACTLTGSGEHFLPANDADIVAVGQLLFRHVRVEGVHVVDGAAGLDDVLHALPERPGGRRGQKSYNIKIYNDKEITLYNFMLLRNDLAGVRAKKVDKNTLI